MDNRQFRNELSYYDIGTNVIYRTAGDDDKIYLLTDFQKVELMDAINKKDAEGKSYDTDRDGISDKKELNRTEEIDVTEFIRKTLYAERYGKFTKMESHFFKRTNLSYISNTTPSLLFHILSWPKGSMKPSHDSASVSK